MGTPLDISTKLSLSDWSDQDKPREKFIAHGGAALSDAELIAILLRTGSSTSNAVELAKMILSSCENSLNNLSEQTLDQLIAIKGIGKTKAITLRAAFELGSRLRSEKIRQAEHIRSAEDIVELMQDKNATIKHEEFWVIYLTAANRILSMQQIGKGGITATVADVRLIIQHALVHAATSIIVSHNHPSGNLTPSQQDKELTKQIQGAANLFNIRLLDHIIIHKSRFYSFTENGLL